MEDIIGPWEFFFQSGFNWWNVFKVIGCLILSYLLIVEPYKYVKDWRNFGTLNWLRQWRCREAMSHRHSCLCMLAMCLDDSEYSKNSRKQLLDLASRWDKLVEARDDDYNKLWAATIAYSNSNRKFRTAIAMSKSKYGEKTLYQRYGYSI